MRTFAAMTNVLAFVALAGFGLASAADLSKQEPV
jgi:hypothetical protein